MAKLRLKTLRCAALLAAVWAVPAAAQVIGSFTPTTVAAGGQQFTLTVNGTNLTPVTYIYWTDPGASSPVIILANGGGTDAVFTVSIPPARIATAGNAVIQACYNSAPSLCGPAANFPIRPTPTLSSLSVTQAIAGSAGFQLALTGTNFTAQDVVSFGGTVLKTAPGGATTMTATVPASAIANPGSYAVSSVDFSGAGALSNSLPFTVGIQLTSLGQTSVLAGSGQPTNVSVNGIGGLASNTNFYWNGTTLLTQSGSPSATNAQVQIPANLTATPTVGTITAVSGGQTSNGLTFSAVGPSTTSISPTSTTVGSGNVTMTINGSNFGIASFGNAQVIVGGTASVSPSSNTGSQITATIPSTLLTAPGAVSIAVENFASAQGPTSNSQTFTIYALPVVSSVSPSTIPYNTPTQITVNGTFNVGDQIQFNGTTLTTTGTTTQLKATVPGNLLTLGVSSVRVINPANTASTTSAAVNVIPVISSLNPNTVTAGSGQFLLTVNVTGGFPVGGAPPQISFNGTNLTGLLVNANSITATIPANLVTTGGVVPVTVSYSFSVITETSAPVNFTISAPLTPTITSVTPNLVTAGAPDTVVTIAGTNFEAGPPPPTQFIGSKVLFTSPNAAGPVTLTPSSTTPNSITVTIPQAQLAVAGAGSIAVTNVSDGTTSSTVSFVVRQRPTISSLTPNPTPAGVAATLSVLGANFSFTDTVMIGPAGCTALTCLTPLTTTFLLSTNLTASVTGTNIPVQGFYNVYVKNSSGDLSAVALLTVGLQITSLTPSAVDQNVSPPPVLVVQAPGGLTSNSVIYFNGAPLVTAVDSATQAHATLSAANVATAGAYPVTIQTPSFPASNALTFTVAALGSLSSIVPASANVGSAQTAIQVNGTNFNNKDTIRFGTTVLTTTYLNQQALTAVIPASLLTAPGSVPVTVIDSFGTVLNAVNFQVQLHITSLSPAVATAGGSTFALIVNLSGAVSPNLQIVYGGTGLATTSGPAGNQVEAQVPASLIASVGSQPVYVTDGTNQSNTVNQPVLGPLSVFLQPPNYVEVGLNGLPDGPTPVPLNLGGTNFDRGTTAYVKGVAVPTTFNSSTSLTLQVPGSVLQFSPSLLPPPIATPLTAPVYVVDAEGRSSNTVQLAIVTPLALTTLSPPAAAVGSPQVTITLAGTGFDTTDNVTWLQGDSVVTVTSVVASPTQITAFIPASLLTAVGTATIEVVDGHGRTSNGLTFSILTQPTITVLNPSSAQTGTGFSLTIIGTGFLQSLPGVTAVLPLVYFGGNSLRGTPISDTEINVTIPAAMNATPGTVQVTVVTSTGLATNSLPFVSFSNPFITGLSPSSVNIGTSGLTLAVSGAYFLPGAVIELNGSPLVTTFLSSTVLSAPLPVIQNVGTESVIVVNPGGLASNTLSLGVSNITPTAPTLTALSPSSVAASGPGFALTATGSNFQTGAVINFGTTALATTMVNSSQLTGTVPANLITQPASVIVYVSNPSGPSTNALTFTVTGKPLITSLTPPSISAGAAAFTLGVTGLAFQNGAVVSLSGTALTTTFVSANQLSASVPAALVKTSGQLGVVVTNPDLTASAPVAFNVNAFTLTSVSPASAAAGGAAFAMTLTGIGFSSGATAFFNGTALGTAFVSASTLTASVPASLIATGGPAQITVANPDGAVAGPVAFFVQSGLTLVSINPATIPANSTATAITATGTGFVQGSQIVFNGSAIATTFVGATSLTGTIPASQLTQAGPVQVSVTNPAGGGSSNALTFTIGPPVVAPAITGVAPSTAVAGAAATPITISGSGFVQGSATQFAGAAISTQFVTSTQLTALLSAAQLAKAGVFPIQVVNPDGGKSNTVNFTVTTPLSISGLSPASVYQGAGDTAVTITGVGIVSGATAQVGSAAALAGNVSGSTSVSVTVPAAQFASAGPLTATVKNPDGTVSNALALNVVAPPQINLTATITPAGTNQVTITVSSPAPADLTGTLVLSFVANASNTPSNYIDPAAQFASGGTTLTFTIPKGATAATLAGNGAFSPGTVAGTLTLTLSKLSAGPDNVLPNPAPAKSFTIAQTAPSITASSVKFVNSSSTGFTIELTGFTTTREIKTATLTFTSSQTIAGGNTATVDVTSVFNTYFGSTTGAANGGTFKLDIPFTISGGDASIVTGVSVTLTNSVGTSPAVSGTR